MKKSHLKQFIKEEIRSVLQESINESKKTQYITDQEQADKAVATLLKQGKTKEWIKSNIGRNRTELKFIGRALKAVTESINEDQFEASLSDPKKYKMGTMWFKRWWKPKKGMDGWTWDDDGRYIWLTRPDMNRPTVRFEKDTGLLQGNWVDPKEMQWE